MYYFESFVSNGHMNWNGKYALNHIGFLFTTYRPTQNGSKCINAEPTLETNSLIFSKEWKRLDFNFIADSNYNFPTIGNFRNDKEAVIIESCLSKVNAAYYFFDDLKSTQISDNIIDINNSALYSLKEDTVQLSIYDWNIIDGDQVTVKCNSDTLLKNHALTEQLFTIKVPLQKGNYYFSCYKEIK